VNDNLYTVGLVVDLGFGDRLLGLASRMPVWLIDTPINRAAAERHWRTHTGQVHTNGVTTFKYDATGTPEQWCSDVLSNVDLHHGQYSHDPPYSAVEVLGTPLTEKLRTAFNEFGFMVFSEHTDGFRASIRVAV
jgi:hypothetical protein